MGIKIMMPPEVMDSVAGALIAKQVLREIVRRAVKTQDDEHYFAVVMHEGVSEELSHFSFNDLAKLLTCPTSRVRAYIAEHMISGIARGGCKICKAASKELKTLIVEEKGKNHGSQGPFSLFIALSAITSSRRRYGHRIARDLSVPTKPRFPA